MVCHSASDFPDFIYKGRDRETETGKHREHKQSK